MSDLQSCKDYLRVDGDDEDALIVAFLAAAKGYLANAGVKESAQGELYDTVILMLVALFYEHRDTVGVSVPPIINNLITQLAVVSTKNGGGSDGEKPD
ncbi:head-tail connector protein [Paenibacillaceae bacterium WGS1546]|uniref:head-tail connector protein n=1 Tax=Cohnella sp. WGS1546 TaxID=3366810 RepID=UPI00372D6EAC